MVEEMLRPFQLGGLTLPNRVVMTAMKLGYGTEITDRHLAFYVRRAQGRAGLMTSEPMYVQANGRELAGQLGIHTDAAVDGLRRLTEAVHAVGGLMMAHINHAGRAANPSLVGPHELVSASDVLCPANHATPRPLQGGEISAVVSAFGAAAGRARRAGFDSIEIPFSHGYLIHQFLSPHTNHRDDDYGGEPGNRFHLGREIIAAVREEIGGGVPIVVRLNANDYVDGGLGVEDSIAIARLLSALGVDAISVTSGTMCETVPYCLYPAGTPKANLLPMAARIKEASGLPVIVAGRIRSPAVARQALEAGQTDLIGLGRPFLADPDWVSKTAAGDEQAILLCAGCHQGCLAQLRAGQGTHCMVNPMTGREAEIQVVPTHQPREVMVVGGGPAGLQAAAAAALRGHHVTLYEGEAHLGGQLRLAANAPHKEDLLDAVRQYALVAARAGVDLHLGTKVTPRMVLGQRPDAMIVATGGVPLTIAFPGLELTRFLLATEIMSEEQQVKTASALVIGGGLVGLEVSDFLAAAGKTVTVVEMLSEVGTDMDPLARSMLLARLKKQGVVIHRSTRVTQLTKDMALAERDGKEVQLPIETVIVAVGVRPNRQLAGVLQNSGIEMHVVGDAFEARNAVAAIREGFEAGLAV